MSGRDPLTDERRLFEELCKTEWLAAGFRNAKKNKGSPGVDGVTIAEFEARLDEELSELKAELESWTYKPAPVRRVEIRKPGGKGIPLLGVPTVLDRVVHATLKLLLEPIFEPLFSDHSYGFRPERSQGQAVEAARKIVAGGKPYVVDLDLSKFFDRIHHDRLIDRTPGSDDTRQAYPAPGRNDPAQRHHGQRPGDPLHGRGRSRQPAESPAQQHRSR
jgi:RNA-directed DNA polymerase